MKKNKYTKIVCFLLALVIGGAASFNLFTNNGFSFHDETQIVNLFEYNKVIKLGQFPPRWSPDTHFTYGSPYPEFNYQLPYYIGIIFHSVGFSFLNSYKLVLALSLIFGAIGMYVLGVTLGSPIIGLVSTFLFTFTPYRAVDVYARGTIGESLGIALFPWIFLCLQRLKVKQNFSNIFITALGISALILTHQPSTAFGLPIILFIFIFSELLSRNYKYFVGLFGSLALTFGLSSFYLIPLLLEQKFIKPVLPFNFYDHFPFLKQLIYSKWGYGVSIEGPYDGMSFQMGFANIAVIIIGLVVLFVNRKKISKNLYLLGTTIGIATVLFLMNIRSSFIWNVFPFTSSIQFPWRLLAIMAFLTSLVYVYILSNSKGITRKILLVIIPLIALANNFTYFHPGTIVSHTDDYYLRRYLPNQVLLKGELVSKSYLDYTENYLPLPVDAVRPESMPTSTITSAKKDTAIILQQNTPFFVAATIKTSVADKITFNRFFFPGWTVTLDGNIQKPSLNHLGAMEINIPQGSHEVSLRFQNTPVRTLGNGLSLFTAIFSIFFLTYHSLIRRVQSK